MADRSVLILSAIEEVFRQGLRALACLIYWPKCDAL